MTVYIEVVLINNLALNLLLITSVSYVRRRKVYKLRAVLAAVAGSVIAAYYAVAPEWAGIIIKIALAPVMTIIFGKYKGFKDYFISLATFATMTYALGGITGGLGYLFGVDFKSYVTLGIVAAGALTGLVLLKIFICKRASSKRRTCDVEVTVDGKAFKIKGMCDTGNTLTDSVSGLPVVILSENVENEFMRLDNGKQREIEGFIEVGTVAGKSSMPIVKVDSINVSGRVSQAYAALSHSKFDGFDVILQNTMF